MALCEARTSDIASTALRQRYRDDHYICSQIRQCYFYTLAEALQPSLCIIRQRYVELVEYMMQTSFACKRLHGLQPADYRLRSRNPAPQI